MSDEQAIRYDLAGWLAIVSAILLIPEIVLAVLVGFISPDLSVFVAPIHVANLCIGVYILYKFRTLLNRHFSFHRVDTLITVLIVINVLSFLIGLAALISATVPRKVMLASPSPSFAMTSHGLGFPDVST